MLRVIRTLVFALVAILSVSVSAQQAEPEAEPTSQPVTADGEADEPAGTSEQTAEFMFIQSANAVTYADGKLTLERVGPTTLFFSDRPERIVGHMTNEEFIVLWSENGDDSFAANPPNATLSVLGDEMIDDVVVELTNPTLEGDRLSYDVTVLDGELPEAGGVSSLFIDPVGMPLTPVSVAGVARRTSRRVVRRRVY